MTLLTDYFANESCDYRGTRASLVVRTDISESGYIGYKMFLNSSTPFRPSADDQNFKIRSSSSGLLTPADRGALSCSDTFLKHPKALENRPPTLSMKTSHPSDYSFEINKHGGS